MDFETGKARIMDALLAHGGLRHLVDVGADVLGNPVFVCDLAAQVMAMSHAEDTDRSFWDEFFPAGMMVPENALAVGRAGIFDQVFSDDVPVYGKFDFFPGRFIGARIRSRDEAIGMATIAERSPFGEHDAELLVVLCQAIVLEMTWQGVRSQASSALLEVLSAAVDGSATRSELDLMAQGARLSLPRRSRVLVIGLGGGHSGVVFPFLQSMLESCLPTSPMVVRHGRLVVLLDLERHPSVPVKAIEACFANMTIRIGAGGAFDELAGMAESYRQARSAMELARRAGHPSVLADYDDWRIDDFLQQAGSTLDLSAFADPVVQRILAHDQAEGTQLAQTLDAYLRCANNAQAAARMLGVHKNTMYARLERIQQLFDVDLESGETCFSLALGLRMRRMLQLRT
ncbi:MAG: helix-turn-helix domain-containing protein [Atopobiaceae bacterium]|nr:helix-turn-helix domain-containing protein [Atopobiaceae bacterium]